MSRTRGRLNRSVTSTAKKYQILVFTEGKKTEPLYLNHWSRLHRERVIVKVADFHADPFSLVREAASQKKSDERSARKGRGDSFDEYWCSFDIDEHPKIPQAIQMAAENGISLAISNPCVELWFALHFRDVPTYIHRYDVQREVRDLLKCGKALPPAALGRLADNFQAAKGRAVLLDRKHAADGSAPGTNPSSNMWSLIEVIRRSPDPL
ncbi:RloB family protein [Actinocorallia sp. API 0066]|uniref:RloB family protein n=1 Tax=Actinocorallia sp. API 0066 TaxID=2896846 RepID=UPI001E356405|nr:RloB family protein [Actinocorallia sp. API 0066]MCD0452210.1 RloB family protein [Actinocorallia sp. API 0066]